MVLPTLQPTDRDEAGAVHVVFASLGRVSVAVGEIDRIAPAPHRKPPASSAGVFYCPIPHRTAPAPAPARFICCGGNGV